jgi:hypothetical protein
MTGHSRVVQTASWNIAMAGLSGEGAHPSKNAISGPQGAETTEGQGSPRLKPSLNHEALWPPVSNAQPQLFLWLGKD